jgi:hypothetical protein
MRKPKKLERLSLESIELEMSASIIDHDMLRNIVGGYSQDCFWRCIAYLDGGGYSEGDAERFADAFFGDSKDLDATGADVNAAELRDYMANHNTVTGNLLLFDPEKVEGLTPMGTSGHVGVVIGPHPEGGYWVFDAQQGIIYQVLHDAVNGYLTLTPASASGSTEKPIDDDGTPSDYGAEPYSR